MWPARVDPEGSLLVRLVPQPGRSERRIWETTRREQRVILLLKSYATFETPPSTCLLGGRRGRTDALDGTADAMVGNGGLSKPSWWSADREHLGVLPVAATRSRVLLMLLVSPAGDERICRHLSGFWRNATRKARDARH